MLEFLVTIPFMKFAASFVKGLLIHVLGRVIGARPDGTTEFLDSLLLGANTILLSNLHHFILLVETALLTTNLKVTRLVYGNEY